MKYRTNYFYLLGLFVFINLLHAEENVSFLDSRHFLNCRLRVFESRPSGGIVSDLIFYTGFADRADNHRPLYKKLNEAGIRVISFDYPSHGESKCRSLNDYSIMDLVTLATEVLQFKLEDLTRPLIVSGWSTGGLVALRSLQEKLDYKQKIDSLILISPGVSVYLFPGDHGLVTEKTLLSNPTPPHVGTISPASPYDVPLFSFSLLANAYKSRKFDFPQVPTLILIAGEKKDAYVNTRSLKNIINRNRKKNSYIKAIECPESMHEMDNELAPIGPVVQSLFAEFAQGHKVTIENKSICREYDDSI